MGIGSINANLYIVDADPCRALVVLDGRYSNLAHSSVVCRAVYQRRDREAAGICRLTPRDRC